MNAVIFGEYEDFFFLEKQCYIEDLVYLLSVTAEKYLDVRILHYTHHAERLSWDLGYNH